MSKDIKNNKNNISYRSYKKWFMSNLILFGTSLGLYIYSEISSQKLGLTMLFFIFVIMTMGWGTSALMGMIENKK